MSSMNKLEDAKADLTFLESEYAAFKEVQNHKLNDLGLGKSFVDSFLSAKDSKNSYYSRMISRMKFMIWLLEKDIEKTNRSKTLISDE